MNKRNKFISTTEVILGTILLTREIYQMISLPSFHDNLYGGLVDFSKYQENTYSHTFLWVLLLSTGITGWLNKKINWIFTQTLLITIFGIASLIVIFLGKSEPLFIVAFILISIVFFLLERRLYQADFLKKIEITKQTKIISILLGLLCSLVYWFMGI